MEDLQNKILDIIQKNYIEYIYSNEAELHASEDITKLIKELLIKAISDTNKCNKDRNVGMIPNKWIEENIK